MDALNSVGGNVMAWMAEMQRESSYTRRDMYLCDECKCLVSEDEWDFVNKCCKGCR